MYFLGASLVSQLIMLAVFLLIIAGLVKWFRDLIYILTHLKMFKHFFFKSLNGKALFPFFIIIVFLCLFAFEAWKLPQMLHSGGCSGYEPRSGLKKSVSAINQAMQINYVKEQKLDLDSIEDFSKMFARRLNVISANFESDILNKESYKPMKFSKKEIKEYNLKEYIDKPMFQTADGMLFIIEKFTPKCEFVDEENPDNSDCIIVVDVNGYKKPNTMTNDAKIPKDRYKIFVYGDVPKAIPLIESHQRIMYDGKTLKEIQESKNGREQQ